MRSAGSKNSLIFVAACKHSHHAIKGQRCEKLEADPDACAAMAFFLEPIPITNNTSPSRYVRDARFIYSSVMILERSSQDVGCLKVLYQP